MSKAIKKRDSEALLLEGLLVRLDDESFISTFAVNPQLALQEAGLEISVGTFTSMLSRNPELYGKILDKVSAKIDVTTLAYAGSSACRST